MFKIITTIRANSIVMCSEMYFADHERIEQSFIPMNNNEISTEFFYNYHEVSYLWGRGGVQWLVRWTSDLKVSNSMPSPCHHVVSLNKKLYPTLSLSTQVYKWVPATYCLG